MKILHIINSLATGGAEKLIVETIPRYREKGIVADVLLLNGTIHPLYKELEEKKCCRIYSLGMTSVYNPMLIGKIIPYLRKYDLIHVHLFPAQYFAIAAKRLAFSHKPFIFTEHSTSNRRFESKKYKKADQIIYNSYSNIICITNKVKEAVLSNTGISKDKLTVIPNGINLEKVRDALPYPRAEIHPQLSEKDFLLLQVSSFQEPKDQSTLIRSLHHLPDHVKLLLAGDGVLRKECEHLAQQIKLSHRVFFLGVRGDVLSLFKSVDIGILSSKWEGFGLVAVEGMASGKPFVASEVPGLSEVVGGAGVLFPQGDDQKLAEEILQLLNDREHYAAVAERCKIRASQYDIHKMVGQHIILYNDLLNN